MAFLNLFKPQLSIKVCRQVPVYSRNDLHTILSPDVNLVYWKRPIDDDIAHFLNQLIHVGFKSVDQLVTWSTVAALIEEAFPRKGQLHLGQEKLVADIVELTHEFLRIANTSQAHLRVVDNDACSRFHTDAYPLRLLCTYIGKATEWVADTNVDRNQIWLGTNDQIVPDKNSIQHLSPFDVALLKGDPGFKSNAGIVHRSPPIQALGEKRFVLRIDVNE